MSPAPPPRDEREWVRELARRIAEMAASPENAAIEKRWRDVNAGPMYCSDPIGAPSPDGRYGLRNLWGQENSQEFDQVSPAMWEEFCLNYQRPILERFGLVSYGCCENLSHKISGVLSLRNLRIFVCSAWTRLDWVVERVGDRYTIMWRQKASDVVTPDDVSSIRRHRRCIGRFGEARGQNNGVATTGNKKPQRENADKSFLVPLFLPAFSWR
jgi:hypothetical protein